MRQHSHKSLASFKLKLGRLLASVFLKFSMDRPSGLASIRTPAAVFNYSRRTSPSHPRMSFLPLPKACLTSCCFPLQYVQLLEAAMCGPLSRRPKRIDPSIIFFNLWWRLYFLTLPGPPVESAFVYCIAVRWSYFFEVLQKYVGHSRCQVCGMFGHRSRSRINKFQSHAE